MNGVRNATMVNENGLPLIMRQIIGRTSTRRMPKEDSTKGKPMFLLAECPGPPVRNFAQRKCGGNQRQSTKRFGRRLAQTRPYQHSYPRPVSPIPQTPLPWNPKPDWEDRGKKQSVASVVKGVGILLLVKS